MPNTDNILTSEAGKNLLAALPALLSQSPLLGSLWSALSGPVVMNVSGGGTYYKGNTLYIDPGMLPPAMKYAQLATVIGHEPIVKYLDEGMKVR